MNLDDEYSPAAKRQAEARAAQQRRVENDWLAQNNQPIANEQQLADAVMSLANSLGVEAKIEKRRPKKKARTS